MNMRLAFVPKIKTVYCSQNGKTPHLIKNHRCENLG